MLSEQECKKVHDKIIEKYMIADVVLLGEATLGGITKRVLYAMSNKRKQRPVVIVENVLALDIDVIIVPVISWKLRNHFDIVLKYWEKPELLEPLLYVLLKSLPFTVSN